MRIETMLEVLWAALHTHLVDSRFDERGGVLLVSPPGQLKTTFLSVFEGTYGTAGYTDLTSTTLVEARDLIASKKITSLLLYDLQKIYERRQDSAENVMGSLRALMGEGFTSAAYEKTPASLVQIKAHALVMAACTPSFYRAKLSSWESTGLARRILFVHYVLSNPQSITQAILNNDPLELCSANGINVPYNVKIPFALKKGEHAWLLGLLKKVQEDVPTNLLAKILSVLRWKYERRRQKDRARAVLDEFSECIGGNVAEISV